MIDVGIRVSRNKHAYRKNMFIIMTSLFLLSPVNRVNKPSASVGNLTFSKYLQHSQPTRTWQILSTEVLQLPIFYSQHLHVDLVRSLMLKHLHWELYANGNNTSDNWKYHPGENGVVESKVKALKSLLRLLVQCYYNWEDCLPVSLFHYQASF